MGSKEGVLRLARCLDALIHVDVVLAAVHNPCRAGRGGRGVAERLRVHRDNRSGAEEGTSEGEEGGGGGVRLVVPQGAPT